MLSPPPPEISMLLSCNNLNISLDFPCISPLDFPSMYPLFLTVFTLYFSYVWPVFPLYFLMYLTCIFPLFSSCVTCLFPPFTPLFTRFPLSSLLNRVPDRSTNGLNWTIWVLLFFFFQLCLSWSGLIKIFNKSSTGSWFFSVGSNWRNHWSIWLPIGSILCI